MSMKRTIHAYVDDPQLHKQSIVRCSTRHGADRKYDYMVITKDREMNIGHGYGSLQFGSGTGQHFLSNLVSFIESRNQVQNLSMKIFGLKSGDA